MANYQTLKSSIQDVIKTNGNNEITGALLQQSLVAMINSLGADYQFAGVATPSTVPGTPDQNVVYIAGPGTYPNFGATEIQDGNIGVFYYNGGWTYKKVKTSNISSVLISLGVVNVEQGSISTADGSDVDSLTRIRTTFFRSPFEIAVNSGYIITVLIRYTLAGVYDSTINVNDTSYSIQTENQYLYRAVVKKGAAGTDPIAPTENVFSTLAVRTDFLKISGQTLSQAQKNDLRSTIGVAAVGDFGYFVCDTAENTAVKTIVADTDAQNVNNRCFLVKMTNKNTANALLKFGNFASAPIYFCGLQASPVNSWGDGDILLCFFDGTNYQSFLFDDAKMWTDSFIIGTTQEIQKNASGQISYVYHKRGSVTVRTDHYVYSAQEIVETRTINTKTLTLTTNLQTLNTTIVWN